MYFFKLQTVLVQSLKCICLCALSRQFSRIRIWGAAALVRVCYCVTVCYCEGVLLPGLTVLLCVTVRVCYSLASLCYCVLLWGCVTVLLCYCVAVLLWGCVTPWPQAWYIPGSAEWASASGPRPITYSTILRIHISFDSKWNSQYSQEKPHKTY